MHLIHKRRLTVLLANAQALNSKMDNQFFCPNCGKKVAHNQKYCHSCGTRLNLQSNPPVQKPLNSNPTSTVDAKPVKSSVLLLDNSAGLRKGKVGYPSKVRVMLYNDHIELHDKNGNPLLNAPLSSLTNANLKSSTVIFTADGQYYSLDFTPLSRRVGFSAFGGLGALVGEATNPARKTAQAWALAMEQNGVRF